MDEQGPIAERAARCVLCHRAETPAPEELLGALARRRVMVAAATSPYHALALVCRFHAAREGTASRAAPVLLIVEPASLPGAAGLVRSAWAYAPRAAVWMYEAAANPQLRAVVEKDVEQWERPVWKSDNGPHVSPQVVVMPHGGLGPPGGAGGDRDPDGPIARIGAPSGAAEAPARENVAPRRAPALRISHDPGVERGTVQDDDGPGPEGPQAPEKPRPLLSAEELEMLLSEQPQHDRGHG